MMTFATRLCSYVVLASCILAGSVLFLPAEHARAATNLIGNPGFESGTTNPDGWIRGRWGVNTAEFSYPAASGDGSRAAKVTLVSRTSGDAKWAFAPVSVTPGRVYEYRNAYTASAPTFITLQYTLSDGSFSYVDVATPAASVAWTNAQVRFTAPAQATKVTVFHLINRVGSLTIDNASLVEIPPVSSNNLVPNPSLEMAGSSGNPQGWATGRWGANVAAFSYPVAGRSGNGAQVAISSHASGDAKWYFTPIPVSHGQSLQFSDFSRSNAPTFITVQFTHTDGSHSYLDLGSLGPSTDWTFFSKAFTVPPGVASLTVFHVLNRAGTLTIDDFSLREVAVDPTKFDQGYVSLNFDDGHRDAYRNALPILEEAGFVSDWFIVTGRTGGDFPGYVSASEVRDLRARGQEVGAHTRTHANLTALSPAEREDEIFGSRDNLAALGIATDTFAYPFGAYNADVQQTVRDAGFVLGRSSNGGYNDKNTDRYALRRQPMLNTTTLDEIKSYVDTAREMKSWVILLFHEVGTTGDQYSVTPQLFQDTVDYLEQQFIAPITVTMGLDLMN